MRRLMALAMGILLSASLLASAHAAQGVKPAGQKQRQGIAHVKKALKSMQERDKKVREVRKRGQAMRQQALARK